MEILEAFTLTQWGLLMDAVGFLVVFFFGAFSIGVSEVIASEAKWWVLPMKIVGFGLVVGGFGLQICGAAQAAAIG